MSERIKVYKSADWHMDCWEHDAVVTCMSWPDAYEAALGHAAMWHTREGA